jgi:hypothetical protein
MDVQVQILSTAYRFKTWKPLVHKRFHVFMLCTWDIRIFKAGQIGGILVEFLVVYINN